MVELHKAASVTTSEESHGISFVLSYRYKYSGHKHTVYPRFKPNLLSRSPMDLIFTYFSPFRQVAFIV